MTTKQTLPVDIWNRIVVFETVSRKINLIKYYNVVNVIIMQLFILVSKITKKQVSKGSVKQA